MDIIKKKEFCSLVRRPVHYLVSGHSLVAMAMVDVTKDRAKYAVPSSNLARTQVALP